jgi:acyl-CoA oxidase
MSGSVNDLKLALLITTRYACIRQQGPRDEQILDYQTVYGNVVPAIAFAFVQDGVDR